MNTSELRCKLTDHESKMKTGLKTRTSGTLYAGAKIDKLWHSNFTWNRNKSKRTNVNFLWLSSYTPFPSADNYHTNN